MARRKKKNSGATAVIVIIVLAVLVVAALVFAWAYKNESGTHKDTGDDTAVENNVSDTEDNVNVVTDNFTTDIDTDPAEDTTDDPEPEEHIEISDITLNDSAELSNGAKATISITAPKVTSTTYAENGELFNELITTEIESFKNEFAQSIAAEVPESAAVDYVFQMTYEVKKSSEGVVSVMLTKYMFTGGAHGRNVYKAINFDLNSGMRADLQYVTGVPAKEYTPFLKANIVEKMKNNPEKPYYSTDYEELVDTFDDSQFLITESGIIVFFQEYDIAPYAAGLQTFEIPYSELIELSSY